MDARAGRRQSAVAFVGDEHDGAGLGDGEVGAGDAEVGLAELLAQQLAAGQRQRPRIVRQRLARRGRDRMRAMLSRV